MNKIEIDKEELTKAVYEGKTGKELEEQFKCGKTTINTFKRKYNLIGISQKGNKKGTKLKYLTSNRINSWSNKDLDKLNHLIKDRFTAYYIADYLKRTEYSVRAMAAKCGLKFLGKIKSQEEFTSQVKELPITVCENYINYRTKLLCLCNMCGFKWKSTPQTILNKGKCPKCRKGTEVVYLYLIYFKDINLYKIGISNNINKRFNSFGYKSEILLLITFDNRYDAFNKEQEWLQNIKGYKYNTGLLKSGNTETFKI